MAINDENFEAWMERFMDRFDKLDNQLERMMKQKNWLDGEQIFLFHHSFQLERMMKQKNWLDGEQILDNQDLCFLLNVTKRTLQRYRMKGILPYFNIDGRNYYRASDVHKLIREKF